MAYLVNMAPRLVELRRVLKPAGSPYLHCDPTMSHYLKVLLDAIFGAERFRGEVTWLRTTTHNDAKRWSPNADILLYYGKAAAVTWNVAYSEYDPAYIESKYRYTEPDGRRYRLDNMTSPNPRPNLTYEWRDISRRRMAGVSHARRWSCSIKKGASGTRSRRRSARSSSGTLMSSPASWSGTCGPT